MALTFKIYSVKALTTAGTAEALSATKQYSYSFIFQADPDNNGDIYIGDSTVSSSNGFALGPGEVMSFQGSDSKSTTAQLCLSDFYIDAATNGSKVRIGGYIYRRHGE